MNDRLYAASSFMSVAIAQVFGSAMAGKCKQREELVNTALPLEANLPSLRCRGGEPFARRVFEPLGYAIETLRRPLDARFPQWGESAHLSVTLRATCTLQSLLRHLYVLIPVLDGEKHFWVGDDEVDNVIKKGDGWLALHPERDEIVHRALKRQRRLTRAAIARLTTDDIDEIDEQRQRSEDALEERVSLNDQRMGAVIAVLKETSARNVLDLGCGEGRLLTRLTKESGVERIVGVDVSPRSLEIARKRLERSPRVELLHGSLTYRDARFAGFDAITLIEVIEHVDPSRLSALERVVFEFAAPSTVVVTTPNAEFNVKFEGLAPGAMRHGDHRFEWTRAQFAAWTKTICERFGYAVRLVPIGPEDRDLGAPTQMAIFSRGRSS